MPTRVEYDILLPDSNSNGLVADFGSPLAVIVTHPWGPLGGNYNNNVVLALVCWFQRLRVTTLRFDFAGSQIGRGHRQVEQVKEAAQFLLSGEYKKSSPPQQRRTQGQHQTNPPTRILLVGYSYGSVVSLSASASIPECIGVASVAPPLAVRHWLFMFHGNYHLNQARQRPDLPQLMIMGSKDNFTSEQDFMDVVKTMPQSSSTGAVLKGADHFFRGREKDLMDILGHWILNIFPGCNGELKSLAEVEFPLSAPPVENNGAQIGYGCNPCQGD